ncbi:uncharacterized protein LOC100198237 isoform X2 [Hydra vulgaris]|uniref:uncharacterized protein LOC100198237 isoform X2 n=1 Tax=Hydra vulgaris TaxID=6087 RepID=UPI000641408C|nr:uncharacterized protein LOC100198237 isoform X2 [Hydra vulgaris]
MDLSREFSVFYLVKDSSVEVGRTEWIDATLTNGENVIVKWPSHLNNALLHKEISNSVNTWQSFEAKVLKAGDDFEELKKYVNTFVKSPMTNRKAVSVLQPLQKVKTKAYRTNKRLHVEEKDEEDFKNHAEKVAKLEAEIELLQRENNVLREKLQKKDAGIIQALNLLENSATELSNTLYHQPTILSSVLPSHHNPKYLNSHASSQPAKQTNEPSDSSACHLTPSSLSILCDTTCSLSVPKWKIPTYPDGSSRMQLISGYNVFIDHVKYYACNKKRGTNKFVSDLLLALVGDRGYLSKVSVSGKNSNAHANKVAKPKICEDLLDAVIACVSQLMNVSSKEVRTAIKSRLNIASKLEKEKNRTS